MMNPDLLYTSGPTLLLFRCESKKEGAYGSFLMRGYHLLAGCQQTNTKRSPTRLGATDMCKHVFRTGN